jgi:hypothetical protein
MRVAGALKGALVRLTKRAILFFSADVRALIWPSDIRRSFSFNRTRF